MNRSDRDQGVTLIELLVAITLMALAFGAVFGGIGLVFRVQSNQRATSTIDVELRNYAEKVLDATYVACPSATQTSYSVAAPTGYTATVSVAFFAGTYSGTAANFTATCGTSDFGMQRITVKLQDTKGNNGTLTVGKTP